MQKIVKFSKSLDDLSVLKRDFIFMIKELLSCNDYFL